MMHGPINIRLRTFSSKSITFRDVLETENKSRVKGSSGSGRKCAAVDVALYSPAPLDRTAKAARGKEL